MQYPTSHLYRKRINRIIENALNSPLVYVQAGSGFGKTRAFDSYFQNNKKDMIWLKMDLLDNLPEHFWKKFIQGFSQKNKGIIYELLQIGFPASPADIDRVLYLISKDINNRESSYLVLDDFHTIDEPVILDFIDQLIHAQLENAHVILLCTDESPFAMEKLNEKKLVSRITGDILLFTREEITEYIESKKIAPVPGQIEKIYQYTEGWALAVNLIVMSLENGRSFEDFHMDILPTVFELMEEEVFSSYEKDVQRILVMGSFLDFFPVDLIISYSKIPRDRIIAFSKLNTFLRYNIGNDSISIHNLYMKFLRSKQSLFSSEEARQIRTHAALWFEEQNYLQEALNCYIVSGLYEDALALIQRRRQLKPSAAATEYYINVIHNIPELIKTENSYLYLYEAHLYLNNMQFDKALELLNETEALYLAQNSESMIGELNLLKGVLYYHKKDPAFYTYFIEAEKRLPRGSSYMDKNYPIIDINRAFACKSLKKSAIEEMLRSYEIGIPILTRLSNGCGAGLMELAHTEISYYRSDLDKAEEWAVKAIEKATEFQQTEIMLNGYFLLLRIAFAKGDFQMINNYQQLVQGFHSQTIISKSQYSFLDVGLSWFYLKLDMKDKVSRWIIDSDANYAIIPPMSAGANHTVKAHWMLLTGQPLVTVHEYLKQTEQLFLEKNMLLSLIQVYMLRGFTYAAEQNWPEFISYFEKAYELVEDGGLDMLFIEIGEGTSEALKGLKILPNHKIPAKWMNRIQEKAYEYSQTIAKLKEELTATESNPVRNLLSTHELLILKELNLGNSREQTASKYSMTAEELSENLKNIYKKLEVTNMDHALHIYSILQSE